jgi:hypothetical protein
VAPAVPVVVALAAVQLMLLVLQVRPIPEAEAVVTQAAVAVAAARVVAAWVLFAAQEQPFHSQAPQQLRWLAVTMCTHSLATEQ